MKIMLCAGRFGLLPALLLLCSPLATDAQIIPIRTVPVATGDQFVIFPSRNLGMGGVSIALDDPLIDPFINPAKGRMIEGARLFAAPVFYAISGDDGSGRTLPVGGLFATGDWFGGAATAVQQIVPTNAMFPLFPGRYEGIFDKSSADSQVDPPPSSGRIPINRYAFAMLGAKLPGRRIAIAAGVGGADLEAVDGVDLLYDGSLKIEQYGHTIDYRLGLAGDLNGDRSFEILLLHTRLNMTHEVTYPDEPWVMELWSPISPQILPPIPIQTHVKMNMDRSSTTGIHLGYVQTLNDNRWRIGGIVTGNWKRHPKIPEYELKDMPAIPRDPGNSWAYNLGVGLSMSDGPALFGVDLIVEPIWTETWGEAAEPIIRSDGFEIPAGGKTIENDFRFLNATLCIGMGREYETGGFQLGMELKSINYKLHQLNNILGTVRHQREHWLICTPSWGGNLNFPEFQLRYTGRLTLGTGKPGREIRADPRNALVVNPFAMVPSSDFLVAPSGSLALERERVLTHQFSVVIPLRF